MPASAPAAMAAKHMIVFSENAESVFHIVMNSFYQFARRGNSLGLRLEYLQVNLPEAVNAKTSPFRTAKKPCSALMKCQGLTLTNLSPIRMAGDQSSTPLA